MSALLSHVAWVDRKLAHEFLYIRVAHSEPPPQGTTGPLSRPPVRKPLPHETPDHFSIAMTAPRSRRTPRLRALSRFLRDDSGEGTRGTYGVANTVVFGFKGFSSTSHAAWQIIFGKMQIENLLRLSITFATKKARHPSELS